MDRSEVGRADPTGPRSHQEPEELVALADLPQHPRGTLAILVIYAALFAVGWVAFYVFIYLARGATTH